MAATVQAGSTVDAAALKVNQASIVALVLVGFVLGTPVGSWIVALVAASLAAGVLLPGRGPFQLLYKHLLRPAGLVKPRPRPDEAAPHRFAQALGAGFLAASAFALAAGAAALGWVLALLVVALALLNLVFGFCAGCFAFLQLRRVWRARAGTAA